MIIIGRLGGVALGAAIQHNKTIQTLLLGSNNIDDEGCLSICAGILENKSLLKVSLDDNPIGGNAFDINMNVLEYVCSYRIRI